jgi:ketosteroid isomerase-like protein
MIRANREETAMAAAGVELMRELYAAFARRDLDRIRVAIHPEFEMTVTDELPWGGVRRGPDGFFAFLADLLGHLDPHLETDALFDAGEHVVQVGHTTGTVHATGARFRAREVHVWELRDGLLTSYRVYVDVLAMRAALAAATAPSPTAPPA